MKRSLRYGAYAGLLILIAIIAVRPCQANGNTTKKILEITYENNAKQTVRLDQPSVNVVKMEFKGATTGPAVDTPFGSTQAQGGRHFRADVIFLNEGTSSLPDLNRFTPVATLYTSRIDVSPRRFDSGFPGIPNRVEWFGVKFTGEFYIGKAGTYRFRAVADDGIALMIDDRTVLEDRGLHSPRSVSGEITLYEGMHNIRVDYFQGPKYDIACQLFVTPPGDSEKIFDLAHFDY